MMVVLPLLQLILFGYAINTDVRHMPTVVFDQDGTAASRALAEQLRATGFYDLAGSVRSYEDVELALRRGVARVALVVPPRYGSDVASGALRACSHRRQVRRADRRERHQHGRVPRAVRPRG